MVSCHRPLQNLPPCMNDHPRRPLSVLLVIFWMVVLLFWQGVVIVNEAASRNASAFLTTAFPVFLLTMFSLVSLMLGNRKLWVHRLVSLTLGFHTLISALGLLAMVLDIGRSVRMFSVRILLLCLFQLAIVALFYRFSFGRPSRRYFQPGRK